jgi:hypothetical protein
MQRLIIIPQQNSDIYKGLITLAGYIKVKSSWWLNHHGVLCAMIEKTQNSEISFEEYSKIMNSIK